MLVWACSTIRIVCLMYMVPIEYVLVNLLKKDGYLQGDSIWQLNFRGTEIMGIIAVICSVIWFGVVVYKNAGKRKSRKEETLAYLPEEDQIAVNEFKAAKKRLRMHGAVKIYRDDMISRPGVKGVFCGKIVLPLEKYSREELKVIYFHELMHFKHHDMFYKFCSMVIGKLMLSEKLACHRKKMLDELCESHCDCRTIYALRDEMGAREYFSYILSFEKRCNTDEPENETKCHIIDDSIQLWRRIIYFKAHKNIKPVHKLLCLFNVILYITVSLTLAYFVGNGISTFNDFIYRNTERVVVMAEQSTLMPESLSDMNEQTKVEMMKMQNNVKIASINQGITENGEISVEPQSRYILDSLYLKKGQHVSISGLVIPSTEICWVGIIQEHAANSAYVENTEFFDNEFTVQENGEYQIFVQNNGKESVTAYLNITYDDK